MFQIGTAHSHCCPTDSKAYAAGSNYNNWEFFADRANAARRLMQEDGIRQDQITQVRGFADQRLRKPDNPLDSSNRRISLIVQYLEKKLDPMAPKTAESGEASEGKGVATEGANKSPEAKPGGGKAAEPKAAENKPYEKYPASG